MQNFWDVSFSDYWHFSLIMGAIVMPVVIVCYIVAIIIARREEQADIAKRQEQAVARAQEYPVYHLAIDRDAQEAMIMKALREKKP